MTKKRLVDLISNEYTEITENFLTDVFKKKIVHKPINRPNSDVVKLIYQELPVLKTIGDEKYYSVYVEQVFKFSNVNKILFHGSKSSSKIEQFNVPILFFTDNYTYAKKYGKNIIFSVINLQNPYIDYKVPIVSIPYEIAQKSLKDKKFLDPAYIKEKTDHDGVIGIDLGQPSGDTFVVFKPENTHNLGTEKDLNGFRSFMKSIKK